MKSNRIYNYRLAVFASHLRKINIKKQPHYGQFMSVPLCNIVNGGELYFEVLIHAWLFDCLPILFEEWYYNSNLRSPMLIGFDPNENPIGGVFDFFNLSPNDFRYLFSVESMQDLDSYGGKFIMKDSSVNDIADNITNFVHNRQRQERTN